MAESVKGGFHGCSLFILEPGAFFFYQLASLKGCQAASYFLLFTSKNVVVFSLSKENRK